VSTPTISQWTSQHDGRYVNVNCTRNGPHASSTRWHWWRVDIELLRLQETLLARGSYSDKDIAADVSTMTQLTPYEHHWQITCDAGSLNVCHSCSERLKHFYLYEKRDDKAHFYACAGRKSVFLSSFVALAFRNGSDDSNANRRINSDDDPSTSDINLAAFCPVTLELTRLNCVRQASVSTRVSSTTFAREQHCQALHRSVHGSFATIR